MKLRAPRGGIAAGAPDVCVACAFSSGLRGHRPGGGARSARAVSAGHSAHPATIAGAEGVVPGITAWASSAAVPGAVPNPGPLPSSA
jgi:hypothetical protein